MKKTIYVSGGMSNLPEYNYPAFHSVAADLKRLGWRVVNPAEFFNGDTTLDKEVYMRRDIAELLEVDAIYMMKGWENSRGARLEHDIASQIGIKIFYQGLDLLW